MSQRVSSAQKREVILRYLEEVIMRAIVAVIFLLVPISVDAGQSEDVVSRDPTVLYKIIDDADSIVVYNEPFKDSQEIYTSKDPKDIQALRKSFKISIPRETIMCACLGSETIKLYRANKELVSITNHHGQMIGVSLWTGLVKPVDHELWLKWFDDRGINGPRREFERAKNHAVEARKNWTRWNDAMPSSLRPILGIPSASPPPPKHDLLPLQQALTQEYPNEQAKIQILLAWYGSGAGPWSGFPAYESVAEELLLDYPISSILDAIGGEDLTGPKLEGTARLFGGWSFSKKYPDGLSKIPSELKTKLWEHTRDSTDGDKLKRAERAFAP